MAGAAASPVHFIVPPPLFVSYCQEDDAVCTLSLLLLSTLVRHAKYSFKIVRLCRICQHCSLGSIDPVVKSLLDIPIKVCVANKYVLWTLYFLSSSVF